MPPWSKSRSLAFKLDLWPPTFGPQQQSMIFAWDIEVADAQLRPFEHALHVRERDRVNLLVDLHGDQQPARRKDAVKKSDDRSDWRHRSAQIKSVRLVECLAPWRSKKGDYVV